MTIKSIYTIFKLIKHYYRLEDLLKEKNKNRLNLMQNFRSEIQDGREFVLRLQLIRKR